MRPNRGWRTVRRTALAACGGLLLLAQASGTGGAQTTTETEISHAAESSSGGFLLQVQPPGEPNPALSLSGITAEGEINSEGPKAEGRASVMAAADETPAEAATDAPPNETDDASATVPEFTVDVPPGPPDEVVLDEFDSDASSESETDGGLGGTENEAGFEAISITLGGVELPEPIGTVDGTGSVGETRTSADAAANRDRDVRSTGFSSATEVELTLVMEVTTDLCDRLPQGSIREACQDLADDQSEEDQVPVSVRVSRARATCAWDGEDSSCEGVAASADVSLFGVEPTEVEPGETLTLPEPASEGDPYIVRVSTGDIAIGTTGGQTAGASAAVSGTTVEFLGDSDGSPGLLTAAVGDVKAAVSGSVETERIIARTGAPVLPFLVGGALLVAAGAGLRRYLRRP